MSEPTPQTLVQELHVALYGTEHPASPDTPAELWDRLLDVVARGRCMCPPGLPPDRYDCDVCHGVQQRKQRRFYETRPSEPRR